MDMISSRASDMARKQELAQVFVKRDKALLRRPNVSILKPIRAEAPHPINVAPV
jgi:hypothetical protein